MKIVFFILDSFGIGAAPDAEQFGDQGANTFGHIADYFQQQLQRPLVIPNLTRLGLVQAAQAASPNHSFNLPNSPISGAYGFAQEISSGKDTPSGHWEIAGVPVEFDWGYFTQPTNSFPESLLQELCEQTHTSFTLANCHGSGTDILKQYGDEHCRTKAPICYTSADSVFQVAAHETHFGLDELYTFCLKARELLDPYNIGRVIARPFVGDSPENYRRTGNRRDFSVLPPRPTLLDQLVAAGGHVVSVGKIADIFAHQGISSSIKATGLPALVDATIKAYHDAPDNSLIFTNLVDFDQEYGHRRDPKGYGEALEYFDQRLGEFLPLLEQTDYCFLSADHGCDPTWPGSDHTREFIPVLVYRPGINAIDLGQRASFADIGQTLASLFQLSPTYSGQSFFQQLQG